MYYIHKFNAQVKTPLFRAPCLYGPGDFPALFWVKRGRSVSNWVETLRPEDVDVRVILSNPKSGVCQCLFIFIFLINVCQNQNMHHVNKDIHFIPFMLCSNIWYSRQSVPHVLRHSLTSSPSSFCFSWWRFCCKFPFPMQSHFVEVFSHKVCLPSTVRMTI